MNRARRWLLPVAVTVLTSACCVAAYNVVGGPLVFGPPWWMLLVCAICVYFGLWWTYVHFDPERKETDMTGQDTYERVTDSAGVTCEYRPVEDLHPGDTVIIGWRSIVERVEIDGDRARIYWKGWEHPDQWNPLGTRVPVEVLSDERERGS